MAEGNSLVNFGDISKPATVLIEKISSAVGVLYEPRRIKKKAEAEAEAEKIKAIAGVELTEIQQRGIHRLINQEERKQENIENITSQAIDGLPNDAKVESLEEDWIAHFFDKCDKVSDEQMQSLWASLLTGEATKPGTYSKRTVNFISSMDKKDAELFRVFCQFTWMLGEPKPLIFDITNEIYVKNGIDFNQLKHLEDIGLVTLEMTAGYINKGFGKLAYAFYFGEATKIEFQTDNPNNQLRIGKALFTQTGKELVNICDAEKNQEFYEFALKQLSIGGAVASKAT